MASPDLERYSAVANGSLSEKLNSDERHLGIVTQHSAVLDMRTTVPIDEYLYLANRIGATSQRKMPVDRFEEDGDAIRLYYEKKNIFLPLFDRRVLLGGNMVNSFVADVATERATRRLDPSNCLEGAECLFPISRTIFEYADEFLYMQLQKLGELGITFTQRDIPPRRSLIVDPPPNSIVNGYAEKLHFTYTPPGNVLKYEVNPNHSVFVGGISPEMYTELVAKHQGPVYYSPNSGDFSNFRKEAVSQRILTEFLSRVVLLSLNLEEAEELAKFAGIFAPDPEVLCREFVNLGVSTVCITDGPKPVTFHANSGEKGQSAPVQEKTIFDDALRLYNGALTRKPNLVGCGDAFYGMMVGLRRYGVPIKRAVNIADHIARTKRYSEDQNLGGVEIKAFGEIINERL